MEMRWASGLHQFCFEFSRNLGIYWFWIFWFLVVGEQNVDKALNIKHCSCFIKCRWEIASYFACDSFQLETHTHTHTLGLLLVLFMYLRVPSITVYPVCTQPADLMSPVFIYLRLLGRGGGGSPSNHVPMEGRAEFRETWWSLLPATVTTVCHSYLEAVKLDNAFCSCVRVLC